MKQLRILNWLGIRKETVINLEPVKREGFSPFEFYIRRINNHFGLNADMGVPRNVKFVKGFTSIQRYEIRWNDEMTAFTATRIDDDSGDGDNNIYIASFTENESRIKLTIQSTKRISIMDILLTQGLFLPLVIKYFIGEKFSSLYIVLSLFSIIYLTWTASKSYCSRILFVTTLINIMNSKYSKEEMLYYMH